MPFAGTLRDACADDLPSIQAIYAHHVLHGTASFELEPPSLEEMHKRWQTITGAGLPYRVATEGGRVVGYAYATPYRPRPGYRFSVEDSIYVHHNAAGQGIGRALLAELIADCTAQGYRQMLASIGDSGNAASCGLHAAQGFERAGVFRSVGFKFGRWLDVVLMQRTLGDGDRSAPKD